MRMPVDFQSIQGQVRQWGESAPRFARDLERRRGEARACLTELSAEGSRLADTVRRAASLNAGLRCAAPTAEALDGRHTLPAIRDVYTVLAADGSQINPDRHAQVEYCVINVGAFAIYPGQPQPAREEKSSRLLGPDELYTVNGMVTEEFVALTRDLSERTFLADLARSAPRPLITLTDGPLELFWERETRGIDEFRKLFEEYLDVLRELSELGVITAGYVDKPGSDLVIRMLELATLEELRQAGKVRPWMGVSDAGLFRELLAPGERSALFAIQSTAAQSFSGALALHFFYLNVGLEGRPWIARVELPAWVAEDPAAVDLLHAALVGQSRILGSRPYPYALHRAHEVAVVTLAEKEQLELMLVAELLRRGLPLGEKSNKQTAKDLPGRTRFKS
jgi:hypothetical protein